MTIKIGEFELLILDFNFLCEIIIVKSALGLNGLRRYLSLLLLLLLIIIDAAWVLDLLALTCLR